MIDWALRVVVLAILGYAAVVAAMFFFQRALQYEPGAGPLPDPATTEAPELTALALRPADGPALTAWAAPPPGGGYGGGTTMVFFHGNAGTIADRAERARAWLDAGLGVMLVEWRGYGGNPGRPTESGLLADGRAALAWLRAQGAPPERLVFYGESLGSGVALILAAEEEAANRRPGAVVLDGAFTSAVAVGMLRYPWLPVGLLMKDRYDGLSALAGVTAPLLVLHGERDTIVPVAMGRALLEAAPGPAEGFFPPQGDHVDLYDHGAGPVLLRFLARHLPPAAPGGS